MKLAMSGHNTARTVLSLSRDLAHLVVRILLVALLMLLCSSRVTSGSL